jgi:excisionase family DNA binding protein
MLLPISEVQRQLGGSSRSTIYNLIEAGELRTVHLGRAVRITRDSLLALVKRRTDPKRQPSPPSETRALLDTALARSGSRSPKRTRATAVADSPRP